MAGLGGAAIVASRALGQNSPPAPIFPAKREQEFELGGFDSAKGEYVLPTLAYAPKDLEPHVSAKELAIHRERHHQQHVDRANRAMRALKDMRDGGDASLTRHWARELSLHVSGHVLHTLYWNMMAPASKKGGTRLGGGEPEGKLRDAIVRDFGDLDKFFAQFEANALQVEGDGWGLLVFEVMSGRLMLVQVDGNDDGFVAGAVPILAIDVWEHAYATQHEGRRAEYVRAFRNVIHWRFCEWMYERAKESAWRDGA